MNSFVVSVRAEPLVVRIACQPIVGKPVTHAALAGVVFATPKSGISKEKASRKLVNFSAR